MLYGPQELPAEMSDVAKDDAGQVPGADRRRRIGRTASSTSMNSKPVPDADGQDLQDAQAFRPEARIATAIAEKDTSAPVIQRTTRTRGASVTSGQSGAGSGEAAADRATRIGEGASRALGVRLIFRPRLVERRKLGAGGIGRDDLRIAVERHLQAARVVDLRHQADVRQRDLAAARIGRGRDHLFDGLEAVDAPSGDTRRRSWLWSWPSTFLR